MNVHGFVKTVVSCILCLSAVFFVAGSSPAADLKFGKLNYETIQRNSKRINMAVSEMQKVQQELQAKISSLVKDVTTLEDKLNQEKETLSPQDKQKLESELTDKKQELETERQAMRMKLAFKQKTLMSTITPQVNQTIEKVAKEEGLSIVFRADSVAYADSIVDITDKVLKALDEAPLPPELQGQ